MAVWRYNIIFSSSFEEYFTKEHRFFRDYCMYLDKANDSNNDLFTCAENT